MRSNDTSDCTGRVKSEGIFMLTKRCFYGCYTSSIIGTMKGIMTRLSILPFLAVGIGLFLLGLISLNHIVNNFWPMDVERLDLVRDTALGQADSTLLLTTADPIVILAFLAAVMISVTGLVLPLAYILNRRFGKSPSSPFIVVLRQAMWVGLWTAFCVWLQMHRTFGLGVAFLVAAVFVVFELMLQLRSRAAAIAS